MTDAPWPLAICIVAGETVPDLAAGATVRLRGAGETPERSYTLHATAPDAPVAPDLILTRCGERDAAGTRFGVLRDTAPLPAAAVGEAAPLDATTTITLESIVGIGPGEDGRVPATQQHVVVTVSGATGLDWPHAAATLLVASGHRSATPDIQADPATGRTVIRYSGVPLMTQPTAVAWQITSPTTGQVVRWRTTLAPPPDRATVLAQALVVVDITADPVAPGAPLTLHLVLSNRGPQPLQLTPDDIGLHQGTTPVALTAADGWETPIRTDGRITVTLTVPVDPTQALTLTLGPQAYQISMPTEGG